MSTAAPAPEPIKARFIEITRRQAEALGWDIDAMAREMFDRAITALTIDEGFKLSRRITDESEARRMGPKGPKADGPHDAECIGCGRSFRCHCERQHTKGECYYCHNNTTDYAERRRIFHFGD